MSEEHGRRAGFPKSRRNDFENRAAGLVGAAYSAAFMDAMQRLPEHAKTAVELLSRFVDCYGEVPVVGTRIEAAQTLWRDYYAWSGEHMILTDEGWEPGDAKSSYLEMAKADGIDLCDLIHCEVNAPAP